MEDLFPPPGFISVPSAIPGIEVYQPAPSPGEAEAETVVFKCPQCGATTAFSAASRGLTCTHCGYFEAPTKPLVGRAATQFEFTVAALEQAAQGWGVERKDLECQQCGASTSIPTDQLALTCPFCGSNKVIHHRAAQDILRPRYVLPFTITPDKAKTIFSEWLGSSWLVPQILLQTAPGAVLRGLFLPYWTFDSQTSANWKAEVGHTVTERHYEGGEWKTRTVTRWRWESGQTSLTFDDLQVPGTTRLSSRLLQAIAPFDLAALAPYESKYLAGLQAKAFDLSLEQAWELGRQEMREQTRLACIKQASTSQMRNFQMQLDFSEESWRYILIPIYLVSYAYQASRYQVLVNGQNGRISGQRPADWNKIWLVIALILAPGLFIGFLGLITIPLVGAGIGLAGFGFILLAIGMILAIILYQKAQALDDL